MSITGARIAIADALYASSNLHHSLGTARSVMVYVDGVETVIAITGCIGLREEMELTLLGQSSAEAIGYEATEHGDDYGVEAGTRTVTWRHRSTVYRVTERWCRVQGCDCGVGQ